MQNRLDPAIWSRFNASEQAMALTYTPGVTETRIKMRPLSRRKDPVLAAHDQRCALLMGIAHKEQFITQLGLTAAQIADLKSCLADPQYGAMYQRILDDRYTGLVMPLRILYSEAQTPPVLQEPYSLLEDMCDSDAQETRELAGRIRATRMRMKKEQSGLELPAIFSLFSYEPSMVKSMLTAVHAQTHPAYDFSSDNLNDINDLRCAILRMADKGWTDSLLDFLKPKDIAALGVCLHPEKGGHPLYAQLRLAANETLDAPVTPVFFSFSPATAFPRV